MSAKQLLLPLAHSEIFLRSCLEKMIGRHVSLTITDNSTSMISVKSGGNTVAVRLHRMFLSAGNDVISEVARFIRNRKGKTPLIRDFIRQNSGCLKKTARKVVINAQGKYYHLSDIYRSINEEYFGGTVSARIAWGAKSPRYAVRKRTMGSYSSHANIIRINPVLDRRSVPRYFIEFIVYHEMLHAAMGVEIKNGRRSVHSREFKRRERLFKHYDRAAAWEKGDKA
ncbi:MAG: hypothetical protein A2077_02280 [Nitrospirae bacterium GWC2_46_6]|nr:MAG: hypothetical protein A2077_02280 [Nitrospirae bacterium GWC2_46_6]OGW21920.1 MAG: hypothetical protein A2Z82_11845 [Nitrospirae bacterium GWA2_46_11]OGW24430.1 MAG: hypothetical protein A2X55_01965 [Nitrospirae bacterium GWB2_47_37]HAK89491.1 hypothetical protein [Nitrospiraceae bacterium]HCL80732.1 hypothetical protein [Nitrospiraceae bacterium]